MGLFDKLAKGVKQGIESRLDEERYYPESEVEVVGQTQYGRMHVAISFDWVHFCVRPPAKQDPNVTKGLVPNDLKKLIGKENVDMYRAFINGAEIEQRGKKTVLVIELDVLEYFEIETSFEDAKRFVDYHMGTPYPRI